MHFGTRVYLWVCGDISSMYVCMYIDNIIKGIVKQVLEVRRFLMNDKIGGTRGVMVSS